MSIVFFINQHKTTDTKGHSTFANGFVTTENATGWGSTMNKIVFYLV